MREFSTSLDRFSDGVVDIDFRDESCRLQGGRFSHEALRGYLRRIGDGSFRILIRNPDGLGFKLMCKLPADTPLEEALEATRNFLRLGMDLEPGHET